MQIRNVATISMMLTLGALPAMAAAIQHADHAKMPAAPGKMTKSPDHMKMANEPHHVLAMAYHQNLAVFAKALHERTATAGPLDVGFALVAVSEMRRSFDQMKQHHQDHMKGMSPQMHTKMGGMMENMGIHQNEMNTSIADLERELLSDKPDPKKVSALADRVHKHLADMTKMHEGC